MVEWKKLTKRIPIQIQLSKNVNYEIVFVEDFVDGNTLGETTFDRKQIRIKQGQSPKMTMTVFFHELLHAVSEECGANLTENQILALEKSFHYILKPGNILK